MKDNKKCEICGTSEKKVARYVPDDIVVCEDCLDICLGYHTDTPQWEWE